MRATGACRCAVATAALVSLVGVGVPTAAADQSVPLYGMRPALAGRTTLAGGHFSYALPAGGHADDAVDLVNFSPGPLTVDVYPANLSSTPQGGLAPGQPGAPSTGATSWVQLQQATLILAPRTEARDRFVLSIPTGTPPGDYLTAIVGTQAGGPIVTGNLILQSRVALVVEVRVLGHVQPGLRLGSLTVQRHDDAEDLSLMVTNDGNTLTALRGEVDVETPSGDRTVTLGPDDVYVIPGGSATLTGTWQGLPFLGRGRLEATVTGLVDGRPVGTYRAAPVTLLFIPWTVLGSAAAALAALVAGWLLTRRRRAAWRMRRAEERRVVADYRAQRRAAAREDLR